MNIVQALPVAGRHLAAVRETACYRPAWSAARSRWVCAGYEERLTAPVPLSMLPSSTFMLALGFADPIMLARGQSATACASLLVAPHETLSHLTLNNRQQGLVLRCDPVLAYALLGVPLRSVDPTAQRLDTLLGRVAVRLTERLAGARCWNDRFAILRAVLAARLARGPRVDPAVAWTWQRLRASAGDVRIGTLAAQLGCSRRHLARRFHDQIGLAPKSAARVLRFERATALLVNESWPLAQVAARTGYADQAHLSREVRAMAGRTPTEFVAEMRGSAAA